MAGFAITGGRGFHITFANGVTVSVQFGGGNYCNNYNVSVMAPTSESNNAEVAVFKKSYGGWLTLEFDPEAGDDVLGYQSPEDVLRLLNWAAAYSS